MTDTLFRPEMAEQAYKLCLLGAKDDELAGFFDVNVKTIYRWKEAHPDFADAVRSGKSSADSEVANSLFRRANGYDYSATKVIKDRTQGIIEVPYSAHMPPDVIACIFWLKNRQPDKWRDVQQHEVGRPGDFKGMTDQELRDRAADEAEALGYSEMALNLRAGTKLIDVSPPAAAGPAIEAEVIAGD